MLAGVLFVLAVMLVRAAPDEVSNPGNQEPMDRIHALGLASLPGPMPAFYSPHAKQRAHHLQDILGGQMAYYSDLFHTKFSSVALGVLNAGQWPRVAGELPYGMPALIGSRDAVFVMPAGWRDVSWMSLANRESVPPEVLKKALSSGKTWEQIKFEGADGIGSHEISHSVIAQIGIDPQTHWLDEFLASYAGYAYLKASHPAQALALEIFWSQGLDAPHPMTKLKDFDAKYEEIAQTAPANYGWYQTVFAQRVMNLYRTDGVEFIRKIQSAFPKNGPNLDTAQVLERLETLRPGWKEWAAQLEADKVQPVDLSTIVEL
jgi:hypothetical protein